jgi:hypothetical protein
MASIIRRYYTIVGNVTLEHVRQQNKNGAQWVASIDKVAKEEESAVRHDCPLTKRKPRLNESIGPQSQEAQDQVSQPMCISCGRLFSDWFTFIKGCPSA